jgi:prepilin-type N-terminal cleavage/methylation domain-containing protein
MTKKAHDDNNTSGFTLVELSIVLVVIGLIVGGILVGLDMVKAAELRGTISQVEKYNSAVNTFRVKYNSFPGDILQSYATAFGLFTLNTAVGPGQGDGSGLIEGGGSGLTVPAGETLVFWRHLSDTGLIDGSYGAQGNAAILTATGLVTANNIDVAKSLPPSKLTPRQFFSVYAVSGLNYYQLSPITQVSTPAAYTFGPSGITPEQAYNIDIKLDDGTPNGGSVNAKGIAAINANATWTATSTASNCLSNGANATDTAALYNRVATTGGRDASCSLRFRFN